MWWRLNPFKPGSPCLLFDKYSIFTSLDWHKFQWGKLVSIDYVEMSDAIFMDIDSLNAIVPSGDQFPTALLELSAAEPFSAAGSFCT